MQYLVENEFNSKYFRVFALKHLLNFLSESSDEFQIETLTPTDPDQRGAQLSFRIIGIDVQKLFSELEKLGVSVSLLISSRTNSSLLIFLLVGSSW